MPKMTAAVNMYGTSSNKLQKAVNIKKNSLFKYKSIVRASSMYVICRYLCVCIENFKKPGNLY